MNDLLLRDGVVVRASNKKFFGFYSTIIYFLLRDGVVRDEIIATFRLQYSRTSIIRTSIIRTFRLSGLFDYPDFFSGPFFFMNINKL